MVLHATVDDEKGQFVGDLKQDNFRVFEDKVEQKISLFSREDIPVTMGLVIDNSGSMREKRAQVNEAALTFVKTSNPRDEAFVVNFNDEYYLDLNEDFTSDQKELNEALSRIDSRGSTALYDAIIGSLDHLKKGHKDKRVLLVITDGDDDASRKTFEYTIKVAQQSDAAIYAIGVFSEDDRKHSKGMVRHSKKTLSEIAAATGGLAYFPDNLEQVQAICAQVARDIRNQYELGYYPSNSAKDGTFRTVQVQVLGVERPRKIGGSDARRLLRAESLRKVSKARSRKLPRSVSSSRLPRKQFQKTRAVRDFSAEIFSDRLSHVRKRRACAQLPSECGPRSVSQDRNVFAGVIRGGIDGIGIATVIRRDDQQIGRLQEIEKRPELFVELLRASARIPLHLCDGRRACRNQPDSRRSILLGAARSLR